MSKLRNLAYIGIILGASLFGGSYAYEINPPQFLEQRIVEIVHKNPEISKKECKRIMLEEIRRDYGEEWMFKPEFRSFLIYGSIQEAMKFGGLALAGTSAIGLGFNYYRRKRDE